MKKKVLLCTILALLLSGTAFASGNQRSTAVDARCDLPEISVVIPATAEVFINPYQIPITIESDEVSAQIVSTPACIENKSEVPISVTATLTCKLKEGSDMRLYTATTQDPEMPVTSKGAFVYFEMQAASGVNQAVWDPEYDMEKHQVVRLGTSRPKKDMVVIAQADQPNHFGAFRLTGDCVAVPRTPWTEADGIEVEIAFTFTPLMREQP